MSPLHHCKAEAFTDKGLRAYTARQLGDINPTLRKLPNAIAPYRKNAMHRGYRNIN
jgi:hypothetical protein